MSRSSSGSGSPLDERLSFKIGDLGHVSQIHGGPVPEEGDCRYMAPELLAMDINRELLTKSDIFSLGLTLFEAASLKELPKNSIEDPEYENLKAGQIPYLENYSKDFNALLKVITIKALLEIALNYNSSPCHFIFSKKFNDFFPFLLGYGKSRSFG